MERPLEVLIVEDTEENIAVAKQAVAQLEERPNVTYQRSFDEALRDETRYDVVITDLFETSESGLEIPKGLLVFLKYAGKGVPVSILSSGDRHDDNLGALRWYLSDMRDKRLYSHGERLVSTIGEPSEIFRRMRDEAWKYDSKRYPDLKQDRDRDPIDPFIDGNVLLGHNGMDKQNIHQWKQAIECFAFGQQVDFQW